MRELPKAVRQRVGVLQTLQDDFDRVRGEFLQELLQLEKKYEKMYQPLLQRRSAIVSGESEITEEEKASAESRQQQKMLEQQSGGVQIDEEEEEQTDEEKKKDDEGDAEVKGIPGFWKEVLVKSELYEEVIQEHDVPSLEFLQDIRTVQFDIEAPAEEEEEEEEEDNKSKRGFHIDFIFAKENPFFSNETLRKTYFLDPEDGQTIIGCEGTEIDWKDDSKNLTVKVTIKTQRHKGGKGTRKVRREEPRNSFYNFFKSIEEQMESIPEDEEDGLVMDLEEADFEYGQLLRDRIVPRAVEYFIGEAAMKYVDMIGFGEGDDDDEDDDDDDEVDEEFLAQQMARASLGRGGRRGRGGAAASGAQPECNQQ